MNTPPDAITNFDCQILASDVNENISINCHGESKIFEIEKKLY